MSSSRVRSGWACLLVLLVALCAGTAQAAEPIDVSYISSDAVAAVIIHPRKVLTDPQFEMMPIEILSAFGRENFAIDPVDIEEVIAIFGLAGLANGEPGMGAILRFAKPYDPAKVTAKLGEQAVEVHFGDKKCLKVNWPGTPPFCVHMPNATTLIVGNEPQIKRMLTAEDVRSPLIRLLQKADTSKMVVAVLDFATLRPAGDAGDGERAADSRYV